MRRFPSNQLVFLALLLMLPAAWTQASMRRGRVVATEKSAPYIPAVDIDPAFPIRVHLVVAKWGGSTGVYHGYGSGNLLDANGPQGFDYAYECDVPFVDNKAVDETYQARWRRKTFELEILMTEPGKKHLNTCVLRLAMTQQPFDHNNTAKMVHGVSSSVRITWRDPGFAYEVPTPDFPVRLHLLDGARTEDDHGDHGWGVGNIYEPASQTPGGAPIQGAEFTYECWRGFLPNTQLNSFYEGHWVKPGSELEVLLQRPGSDKVEKCKVKVNLQPQPYPEKSVGAKQPQTP